MLPHNAVEYFVSYYDYYQPEAYIAQTDTYIEKDSSINDDVGAAAALRDVVACCSRRDVVVVVALGVLHLRAWAHRSPTWTAPSSFRSAPR